MRYLILAFVTVPLIELYLLILLSRYIGFGATVAITLVTGVLGSYLAKREGLRAWTQFRASLRAGTPPEIGLIEAFLIVVGGALLITPGVFTDLFGFSLLLPATRKRLAAVIKRRLGSYLQASAAVYVAGATKPPGTDASRPRIVESVGENVDER